MPTSDVGTFRRLGYAVLHDRIDVRFEFEMTLDENPQKFRTESNIENIFISHDSIINQTS